MFSSEQVCKHPTSNDPLNTTRAAKLLFKDYLPEIGRYSIDKSEDISVMKPSLINRRSKDYYIENLTFSCQADDSACAAELPASHNQRYVNPLSNAYTYSILLTSYV